MNRRHFLQSATAATLAATTPAIWPLSPFALTSADHTFLDDLTRRACLFFHEQASPSTGQVLDRCDTTAPLLNPDNQTGRYRMASIAATGFGLTALCIADQRGFQPPQQILNQVRTTLRFHANTLPHEHGFFYHFNDVTTGQRWRNSEVSSIDTALLLCGVLTARAHFHHDDEIVALATTIYNRVDWPWMLNAPLNSGLAFDMGWKPATGFLSSRWSHYCELMMIYLLALGSPTHPVPPRTWNAFTRPRMIFAGFDYISANDPLFVHQYSHAWFDFRHKRDQYADYFANSILATRAHKAFCLGLGQPYSNDYWGISASDTQHGYSAWGGPGSRLPNPPPPDIARGFGGIDGSVVPNAAAGSLPFLPADCLHVLRALKSTYGESAYGRYGFCDAFHPSANWFDPDILGIDQGISLLMAENLRSGFVWQTFNRNPEPAIALKKAGFHPI
jgi:hypothetical protein